MPEVSPLLNPEALANLAITQGLGPTGATVTHPVTSTPVVTNTNISGSGSGVAWSSECGLPGRSPCTDLGPSAGGIVGPSAGLLANYSTPLLIAGAVLGGMVLYKALTGK